MSITPRPATLAAEAASAEDVHPILVRVWRGAEVESWHRGSWVLADRSGAVVEGAGGVGEAVFARSSTKSLQALPLLETGAAERFGLGDEELALALASHDAEPCHTEVVGRMLARLGLGEEALACGPQPPGDRQTRAELLRAGARPGPIHNNCSGKHAGFLALALHLSVAPGRYLDPESEGQRLVREAVLAMGGLRPEELSTAVDGCSAPTFRMPLARLATAFARLATPAELAPKRRAACERLLDAAARHPHLIAGHHGRLCTDLARATGGRLFPKIGGEAVYGIGIRGAGLGLALKVDDGSLRGLNATVVALLERLGFLEPAELEALASWREPALRNWAGLEVGRIEVVA